MLGILAMLFSFELKDFEFAVYNKIYSVLSSA